MVIAMTKATTKIVSMMLMIVVEVVSTLNFVPNVPALVILLAMAIQILCLETAFATMKQTLWNVLMMVWNAVDLMLLLIIAQNVLVMVKKYPSFSFSSLELILFAFSRERKCPISKQSCFI